jgi:hypothetical protein
VTSAQPEAQVTSPGRGIDALRGNCMGAAVLLIIEFALGISVNLYVAVPTGKRFLSEVFSSAVLGAHAVISLLLLGAAIGALVRAIRARRLIVPASVGLAAIVAAGISGAMFVGSQSNGASLSMALATAVAMFCYLVAVFRLR